MKHLLTALSGLLASVSVSAATFVYVSNAEDGDIGMYTMRDGLLQAGPRFKAGPMVMPMTLFARSSPCFWCVTTSPVVAVVLVVACRSSGLG